MCYCKYLQLEPQLPKNTGNWRVASTYPFSLWSYHQLRYGVHHELHLGCWKYFLKSHPLGSRISLTYHGVCKNVATIRTPSHFLVFDPKSESNAKIFTLITKISWTGNAWNLERTYEGPFLSGFTYQPCKLTNGGSWSHLMSSHYAPNDTLAFLTWARL